MEVFKAQVSQAELDDLDRRLRATRWLDAGSAEVADYGTQLSFVQRHCRYWIDEFDWRAVEDRINRQPHFQTDIDGLKLHFIHRTSPREGAIPLLLIHGWPTSFMEFLPVIDSLAEPEGDGPAFHVIIPSLPGYGFSQTRPGTSPRIIAGMYAQLMRRLGYDRFMVQGGNWGSSIGTQMAREHPDAVIGLHLNSVNGSAPPDLPAMSARDQRIADIYGTLLSHPHFNLVAQAPLTVSHAMNDSPAGTLGWLGDKLHDWSDTDLPGNPGTSPEWIVATSALYWLTGTAASAASLYREAMRDPVPASFVTVPTAIAHFAKELVMIPRPWAQHHYNVQRWTDIECGGHYPATEVPELFAADVRSFAAML